MRKILITFVVVAFIGILAWLLSGRAGNLEIRNFPPKGNIIVAFGDSLVAGEGATEGHDFVSLLSRALSVPIENLGRAGDTTATALLRIGDALRLEPHVAIILLGGNDALNRVPKAETKKNLEAIVLKFQSTGAVTLILGVKGSLFGDAYEDMYTDIAKRTGSLYLSNVLEGIFGNSKYMSDGIHPNDAGYALIAERVAELLREIGFERG